jgi:hypothetical protein
VNKRRRRIGSDQSDRKDQRLHPSAMLIPCRREKRRPVPAALAPTAHPAEGELQPCAANVIVPAHYCSYSGGESVAWHPPASLRANIASVLRSNGYRRDLCVS